MNHLHKCRIIRVSVFLIGLGLATGFILYALKQNMNVFLAPAQVESSHLSPDYHFRLGGLVKRGSVKQDAAGLGVEFDVTDFKRNIHVRYEGILPDLFREGKGMIAEGSLNVNGVFVATQVLAKHDENYMPKIVKPDEDGSRGQAGVVA